MKIRLPFGFVLSAALVLAVSALAVDVHLKDGTVIHAASYTVQGSYVIVKMENGSQVAYNRADVDLKAMESSKKEAAQEAPKPQQPSNAFSGAMASKRGKAAMKITDQDVAHVEPAQPQVAAKAKKKGLKDHQEGGKVVVQGIHVEPGEAPGTWKASGQVVNRMSGPVMDVQVVLKALVDSKEVGNARISVASTLPPGQSATFSHTFKATAQPSLRVRVFWMQEEKLSPTPSAGRGGRPSPARSGGTAPAAARSSSRSPSANASTKPVGGGKPPAMQWGGAPAYKHGGAGPQPTPFPY